MAKKVVNKVAKFTAAALRKLRTWAGLAGEYKITDCLVSANGFYSYIASYTTAKGNTYAAKQLPTQAVIDARGAELFAQRDKIAKLCGGVMPITLTRWYGYNAANNFNAVLAVEGERVTKQKRITL